MKKRILFLTGTRADYSKLRPLIKELMSVPEIEPGIFVTGMHMLAEYGSTHLEIEGLSDWDYRFINQTDLDPPHAIFSKTLSGFGDFVREERPDLIVIHGDRIEAFAGALVGVMSNILVAHVEGGELSGTIDDSYRHAISKLAHIHFVSNQDARSRLLQLGEVTESVHVIGSPELDLLHSSELPSLDEVKNRYDIPFFEYGIVIFHPVATEPDQTHHQAQSIVKAMVESGRNFVVIESNNDLGSKDLRIAFKGLEGNNAIRTLPSMRFEYFLVLLKNAQFIMGNSSSGVREAPHYGVPAINIGSRQSGRVISRLVVDSGFSKMDILTSMVKAMAMPRNAESNFGTGNSAKLFGEIISSGRVWQSSIQKTFQNIGRV